MFYGEFLFKKGDRIMVYEKATAEVILFDNSDVITKSGGGGGHYTNECPCNQGQTGTGYTVWNPN